MQSTCLIVIIATTHTAFAGDQNHEGQDLETCTYIGCSNGRSLLQRTSQGTRLTLTEAEISSDALSMYTAPDSKAEANQEDPQIFQIERTLLASATSTNQSRLRTAVSLLQFHLAQRYGSEVAVAVSKMLVLGLIALVVLILLSCLVCTSVLGPQSIAFRVISFGVLYNFVSTGMIETNKWLMHPDHFPFPLTLTASHMLTSWMCANCLRICCPSAFPALQQTEVTWRFCAKFLLIGAMFAMSVVCANAAYQYLSVAFLQMVKQCNIVVIYIFSVLGGLAALNRCSVVLLAGTMFGVMLTIQGELQFQMVGFLLQVVGSLSEAGKVVIQGILMSGEVKLDPLTMVLFMAPSCLLMLILPFCAIEVQSLSLIHARFLEHSVLILVNAFLAFTLNVVVACCIQVMSPVGYIVMGALKDVFIVSISAMVMGDTLTSTQIVGFIIAVSGVASYSLYKQNVDCFKEDELFAGALRVLHRFQSTEDATTVSGGTSVSGGNTEKS